MSRYALFDSLLDGVFILDSNGTIVYANEALANIFTLKTRHLINKNLLELTPLNEIFYETWKSAKAQPEATPYLEKEVTNQDNTPLIIQFSAQSNGNEVVFYVRNATLEANLHRKYRDEINNRENLISELDRQVFELEFLRSTSETLPGEPFSLKKTFIKAHELLDLKNSHIFGIKIKAHAQNEHTLIQSFNEIKNDQAKMLTKLLDTPLLKEKVNTPILMINEGDSLYVISWAFASGSRMNAFVFEYSSEKIEKAKFDQRLLQAFSRQTALLLENDALFQQTITDEKTGLYNYRYLGYRLDQEIERSSRYSNPLSLIIFDIDHFKKVNDTYGHLAGDMVLTAIANILKISFRTTDLIARYGGEEFVALCVETPVAAAPIAAERVRAQVEATDFVLENGQKIRVTISAGIAHFPSHADNKTALFEAADRCLYEAKNTGRNRVVVHKSN